MTSLGGGCELMPREQKSASKQSLHGEPNTPLRCGIFGSLTGASVKMLRVRVRFYILQEILKTRMSARRVNAAAVARLGLILHWTPGSYSSQRHTCPSS